MTDITVKSGGDQTMADIKLELQNGDISPEHCSKLVNETGDGPGKHGSNKSNVNISEDSFALSNIEIEDLNEENNEKNSLSHFFNSEEEHHIVDVKETNLIKLDTESCIDDAAGSTISEANVVPEVFESNDSQTNSDLKTSRGRNRLHHSKNKDGLIENSDDEITGFATSLDNYPVAQTHDQSENNHPRSQDRETRKQMRPPRSRYRLGRGRRGLFYRSSVPSRNRSHRFQRYSSVPRENNKADDNEKIYTCRLCDEKYPRRMHSRHMFNRHKRETRNLDCKTCSITFDDYAQYKMHLRIHENLTDHHCPLCRINLKTEQEVLYHIQSFHYRNYRICRYCNKVLSVWSFNRHCCDARNETTRNENTTRNHIHSSPTGSEGHPSSSIDNSPVVSPEKTGSDSAHETSPSTDKSGRDHYRCEFCRITFEDNILFIMHMGLHGTGHPFQCSACRENFPNNFSFMAHFVKLAKCR